MFFFATTDHMRNDVNMNKYFGGWFGIRHETHVCFATENAIFIRGRSVCAQINDEQMLRTIESKRTTIINNIQRESLSLCQSELTQDSSVLLCDVWARERQRKCQRSTPLTLTRVSCSISIVQFQAKCLQIVSLAPCGYYAFVAFLRLHRVRSSENQNQERDGFI